MGLQDLLITPFYFMLFLGVAYMVRGKFTNDQTKKYFLPALAIRFFGAIMLGVIYQFYYGGGDTFNYFDHGSKWIWEAFLDDSLLGLQMILEAGGSRRPETFIYSQHIWYYGDPASYFIVRIAALIDIFTFHTYSATALFFAVFSFSGVWALFCAVQQKYPQHTRWLAYGILFFPSVVFWGSGILKDTVTLAALCWMTWALIRWIELKKRSWREVVIFLLALWLVYSIKVYIVICFVPLIFVWLFFRYMQQIRSLAIRVMVVPMLLIVFGGAGFLALRQISAEDAKYSLDNVAERARITAYDIRYGWGAREGGDGGYDIGLPDGTIGGMVRLAPAAINVSLFRPYIWEVKNPLMLLAALESMLLIVLTLRAILKKSILQAVHDPFVIFCFTFAMLFAFAVGVSTFNFGTLMRYKIPLMPFYVIVLVVMQGIHRKEKALK